VVKNNLIVQNYAAGITNDWHTPMRLGAETDIPNNTWDNNCYYFDGNGGANWPPVNTGAGTVTMAAWQALTGSPDPHGVNADPLFVAEFTDLHLGGGSPCINAGATGTGVKTDRDGKLYSATTPAIGCYEYVA
jgi:hypothetical protein